MEIDQLGQVEENRLYISNEYNRNAGLTVDRCGLLVSIYVTVPLLDAALPPKSITKNGPMREFWRESI